MIRHAVRALWRAKGLTLTAVLTLGLGIGGVTAMFSVVDAALIRSAPFPAAGRLLVIWQGDPKDPSRIAEVSHFTFRLWQAKSRSFSELAAMGSVNWSFDLTGRGDRRAVPYTAVSSSFFRTLGVQPVYGRGFVDGDDQPGAARVVIVSYSFWRSTLGGDPGAVGQPLMLSGVLRTVVGVMPSGFEFPSGTSMWAPVVPELAGIRFGGFNALDLQGFGILYVVARLADHATVESGSRELASIERDAAAAAGYTGDMPLQVVTPMRDFVSENTRPALVALAATSAAVLLIACMNVCSLLLMRVSSARRIFAIRGALGATSVRIAREELAVAMCLSVAGSVAGALVAVAAVRGFQALAPSRAGLLDRASVDVRAVAAASLACLISALLCGVVPALRAARATTSDLLGGRSTATVSTTRFRNVLASLQVALAVVVLLLAALALRSAQNIRSLDLGFNPAQLMTMRVSLPDAPRDQARRFTHDLLLAVRNLPGVRAAAGVSLIPLQLGLIGNDINLLIDGQRPFPALDARNNPIVVDEVVTPGYFDAMHTPLLHGRDFTEDDDERRPRVVIVSEGLARALWPGQDALGKRVQLGNVTTDTPEAQRWSTVVGIVGDIRYRGVTDERPDLYEPYSQSADAAPLLVIRTESAHGPLRSAVREASRRLQPQAQVDAVDSMDAVVARATAAWTFNMWLFSVLAATGVLLAAIGLYGLLAYLVIESAREMGVRLALGATPRSLCFTVLRRGLILTAGGLILGMAMASGAAAMVQRIVYGVRPLETNLVALVCLVLLAVGGLAAYIPARRTISVDPAIVLRNL
jgi:predicted permease